MGKKGLIWAITGIVVAVVIAVILLFSSQDELQLGKVLVNDLPEGTAIMIDTAASTFGVKKGDIFYYYVDILYNPALVEDIDKDRLLAAISLDPFEIRNVTETDFVESSDTYIYWIQYELQFINGDTDVVYEIPSIVVTYKTVGSEGYLELPGTAESVYVSSRLPDDLRTSNYDIDLGYGMLRPLSGAIISIREDPLPWILIAAGAILAIGSAVDYGFRVIPQRSAEKVKTRAGRNLIIAQDYKSLYQNVGNSIAPDMILLQIDRITRIVLIKNEEFDWLEELKLDNIPSEIRETVVSLFTITQKAGIENMMQDNVRESLEYLDKILRFYYAEEVDSWKN
jgi:hypothetical protein